jgi:hypothetical protein
LRLGCGNNERKLIMINLSENFFQWFFTLNLIHRKDDLKYGCDIVNLNIIMKPNSYVPKKIKLYFDMQTTLACNWVILTRMDLRGRQFS